MWRRGGGGYWTGSAYYFNLQTNVAQRGSYWREGRLIRGGGRLIGGFTVFSIVAAGGVARMPFADGENFQILCTSSSTNVVQSATTCVHYSLKQRARRK